MARRAWESADVMRYFQASALDYSSMPIKKFAIHLMNFNKIHAARSRRELQLHGMKVT